MDQPLVSEAVRTELEPFLFDRGFREADANAHSIVYESTATRVTVTWDPRGEIDVKVSQVNESSVHADGTTGRSRPWMLCPFISGGSSVP